jgi:hypothetical protein
MPLSRGSRSTRSRINRSAQIIWPGPAIGETRGERAHFPSDDRDTVTFNAALRPCYACAERLLGQRRPQGRFDTQNARRATAKKSIDMLQAYVRDADLFRDHAGAALL